jgi:hypothetical protein
MGNSEGKRSLGRPRRSFDDNIEINCKENELDGVDWIHLAQDMDQWKAVINTVMNLRVL